jgi:hypothetical protein
MSALVPRENGRPEGDYLYLAMTADQRLAELAAIRREGEENLKRLAALVWAMKQAGDDMTPAKQTLGFMFGVLFLIGGGQLSVEAFHKFGAFPRLYNVVRRLPLADQGRVCEGPLPVFDLAPDGTKTHRMVQLLDMTDAERDLAFDGPTIRTLAEQEEYLLRRRRRPVSPPRPDNCGRFKLDDETATVRLGNHVFDFAAVGELYRECRRRGWHRR